MKAFKNSFEFYIIGVFVGVCVSSIDTTIPAHTYTLLHLVLNLFIIFTLLRIGYSIGKKSNNDI